MENASEYSKLIIIELNKIPSYIGNAYNQSGMHLMAKTEPHKLNLSLLRQYWTAGSHAADDVYKRDVYPHMPQLISDIGPDAARGFLHRIITETNQNMNATFAIMQVMLHKMQRSKQVPQNENQLSPAPSDAYSFSSSSSVVYAEVGGDGTTHNAYIEKE